ncbi:MAG: serine hydroxymethyltransferase [Candidatus Eisenbacteria bacterium]
MRHGEAVAASDPQIHDLMLSERRRLQDTLCLVASESVVDPAILEATGNLFSPKYAEGYPGERLYPGCDVVDRMERLAVERAVRLFGAGHANVQPYSGTQANMAAYFSVLTPGDTILSMSTGHGGHPSHGGSSNFSGQLYRSFRYGVKRATELIDYDEVTELAAAKKPRLIIAGGSAYSRHVDFARMRTIADSCGAMLMVDMAHLSGLVAGGVHPSPVPYADVITSTTHKTLLGPRGGLILCRKEYGEAVDRAVFPGTQGGPLMHVVSAKAVCFRLAQSDWFRGFMAQVVSNSRALCCELQKLGYRIVTGGTDSHLLVVDTAAVGVDGSVAWKWLEEAGILVNKCAVPFGEEGKFDGIRLGTLTLSARGLKEKDMCRVAVLIGTVLRKGLGGDRLAEVRAGVKELCREFAVY